MHGDPSPNETRASRQFLCRSGSGPRERLERHGPTPLGDAELLALILGTGHAASGDALALATELLQGVGDLARLCSANVGELQKFSGVGLARAARLVAVGEIARRASSAAVRVGRPLTSSASVHAHFGPLLVNEKREHFVSVLLDTKNRFVAKDTVSVGSLGASLVHPREAFRRAVREAAASVIFVHNHPSGDPTPSAEDLRVTQRLRDAGEVLGIPVLDHVVVGGNRFYSFADSGWPTCL